MRTDENNNPTAMTTDVANEGGLILNADYIEGTPFPDNPPGFRPPTTFFTAKLLGDPIQLTIKVIDKAGFFTSGGQARWTYVAIPYFVWLSLTEAQKIQVIGGMYRREGGVTMKNLFPVTW